jgi:hypothetical protein
VQASYQSSVATKEISEPKLARGETRMGSAFASVLVFLTVLVQNIFFRTGATLTPLIEIFIPRLNNKQPQCPTNVNMIMETTLYNGSNSRKRVGSSAPPKMTKKIIQ